MEAGFPHFFLILPKENHKQNIHSMKYIEVDFRITPTSEDLCDILSALLAEEADFETFTLHDNGMMAYVQKASFEMQRIDEIIANFPIPEVEITYTTTEAEDRNWNEEWEQNGFRPIEIGNRLCVHDSRHEITESYEFNIKINPQQAFGSGSHQTTSMILQYLMDEALQGKRVLDAGCGTGILSIMASMRGADNVFAYDIDEWSVRNTELNLSLNNIQNVKVVEGYADVLKTQTPFDLILANINRNILIQDMEAFTSVLKKGGKLVLSGFYTSDIPLMLETTQKYGLQHNITSEKDEWAMLVFTQQ